MGGGAVPGRRPPALTAGPGAEAAPLARGPLAGSRLALPSPAQAPPAGRGLRSLTHFRLHQLRRHLGLQRPPRREPPPSHVTPAAGEETSQTRTAQSARALFSPRDAASLRTRGRAAPPRPAPPSRVS